MGGSAMNQKRDPGARRGKIYSSGESLTVIYRLLNRPLGSRVTRPRVIALSSRVLTYFKGTGDPVSSVMMS